MYAFIMWACLASAPQCQMYNAVQHMVFIWTAKSMEECEADWKESQQSPDPEGMKSYHVCKPIDEAL
jgi:hypothetical protein